MELYHTLEQANVFMEVLLEFVGVLIIFIGVLMGLYRAGKSYFKNEKSKHIYMHIREEIAHSILLSLEILIAVDIIKTVTTELTMANTLALGLIVVIRTILSISLEVEIENRFPWQKKESAKKK